MYMFGKIDWIVVGRWTSNSSQSPAVVLPSSLKSGFSSLLFLHLILACDHQHWWSNIIVPSMSSYILSSPTPYQYVWLCHHDHKSSHQKPSNHNIQKMQKWPKVEFLLWEPWMPSSKSRCLCQGKKTGHFAQYKVFLDKVSRRRRPSPSSKTAATWEAQQQSST